MDTYFEMSRDEYEDIENNNSKDLEAMKKRLKEIEKEIDALHEIQAKVEKEMGSAQEDPRASVALTEKEEVDARSIYVSNVDYACTPEEALHAWPTNVLSLWLRKDSKGQEAYVVHALLMTAAINTGTNAH
nr:polyadenylate-binding protein 2-like [Tanacetum cinerariifolium]